MYIKLELLEDKPTQMPHWSAKVINNQNGHEEPILQVVSQTFNPKNEVAFKLMYENCTVKLINELLKEKDQAMLKHMLINNPS